LTYQLPSFSSEPQEGKSAKLKQQTGLWNHLALEWIKEVLNTCWKVGLLLPHHKSCCGAGKPRVVFRVSENFAKVKHAAPNEAADLGTHNSRNPAI